ncbi:MAG: alpha/beta hydrolase, partial [Gammaproteobacteria bacterium]|nr:alpha/beta hydrolase [Gammaproteobacteria bacterium]
MQEQLPGRLGDPNMTLLTDPRMDPRVAELLAVEGDLVDDIEPLGLDADRDAILAYCREVEATIALAHPLAEAAMPDFSDVHQYQETIQGVDGNDITLYIHEPINREGPLPCVFHTHGGGMVILSAKDPNFVRWRNALAQSGLVVVGVEFRNGGGQLGDYPFPAGLNDCDSALQWTNAQREQLGIS